MVLPVVLAVEVRNIGKKGGAPVTEVPGLGILDVGNGWPKVIEVNICVGPEVLGRVVKVTCSAVIKVTTVVGPPLGPGGSVVRPVVVAVEVTVTGGVPVMKVTTV